MKAVTLIALLLVSSMMFPVTRVAAEPSATAPVVAAADGRVQGRREAGLSVFQGIPFAAPPVGPLRWREPQPVVPWQGVRKADAYAASCMQKAGIPLSSGGTAGALSEDCLYLNVWTPAADGGKRPVMVWIHGGALVYGSGNVALYDGTALARRDAVVVTVNYRMGALGFFSHPAIDQGKSGAVNYGLYDQIAALHWVRDNIAAFGGDPGNVTVFGESAGAQSVLALYASPLARGLFHKGIAQSAYGIPSHTRAKAREVSEQVATAVGLAGARATAGELRSVPAARFFELGDQGPTLAPSFILGDTALPRAILDTFQAGQQARVPLVIGNNSDEATVATAFGVDPAVLVEKLRAAKFLLKKLYPGVDDEAQLGRETVRDVVFSTFARRISRLHSRHAPAWRYYFSHVQENLRGEVPGVGHGSEIAFVMDTGSACQCLTVPFTATDRAYAQQVGDYWVSFARSGVPAASGGPVWTRDTEKAPRTLEFGEQTQLRTDFMKQRLDTFSAILRTLGAFLRR